jgi:hypothetical protein
MNPLNPLDLIGRGIGLARGAVGLATAAPKIALHLLRRHDESTTVTAQPRPGVDERSPSGAAPGGTGRRPPTPARTPGRATTREGSIEVTKGPPEPTSAAGASVGVAGTAAAPGSAAAASAPDPTAATTARHRRTAPQGERRTRDVSPAPSAARPRTPEPKRSEIDRRREEAREAEAEHPAGLVESEGAAAPGAQIHVDAPFEGYDAMKAAEIVARAKSATDAERAVIRLYEQTHKKRKSILDATAT